MSANNASVNANESENDLRSLSVESIEAMYRRHEITNDDKLYMLREKARVTLKDLIQNEGTTGAILERIAANATEGWNNIVEAATRERGADEDAILSGADLYNGLKSLMGTLQIWGSVTEGIGEVLGMNAENSALAMGAPPALARTLNVMTWLAPQVVPVGLVAKAATSTAKLGAKAAASKLDVAMKGLSKETREEMQALAAMADGLADEGVENALEVVAKSAKAAGKTEVADALKRVATEAPKELVTKTERSVIEQSMSFSEEVAQNAKAVTEEAARKELPALMKKLGVSRNDLKAMREAAGGRQIMNAQQFYGTLKALESRGTEMSALARKAVGENATDADRMRFAQYATSLYTGSTDKVKLTKEFQDMLMHWDPARVAAGDIHGALRTFAEDMAAFTPKQMSKNIFKNQDGFARLDVNWWGIGRELYSNALLPLSWPTAIVGNSISTGIAIAERATGGSIPEAFWMVKGMTLAMGDAMQLGRGTFSVRGALARNAISSRRHDTLGKATRITGRIVNSQRDSLIAVDTVFKTLLSRGHLYAEGARMAHAQGVSDVGKFVNSFVANPQHEFVTAAVEFARRGTFNNDLGALGTLITKAAKTGPGYLWFTFVHSPTNLAKFAWNRTPGLQLLTKQLYADIAAGGTRADEAMARLTLGTLQGMFFWEMAKEGRLTGSGPVDPDLKRSWRATHEPFSAKSDNAWFPLDRLEPALHTMGFIADMAQIWDQLDDVSAQQAAIAIAVSTMHNFVDRTPARTAFDVVDMLMGVKRGERMTQRDLRILENPLTNIVTGGPLVARTARILDPVSRDQRTFSDMWKARIPGYSTEVPPLRDGYLDPIVPPETMGTPWFGYMYPLSPPKAAAIEDDPIKVEGSRLQVKLPYYGDVIGRGQIDDEYDITKRQPGDPIPVKLTPQQRERWQQIGRNILHGDGSEENPGIINGLLSTDAYKDAAETPALQREMFSAFMTQVKSKAARALIVEDQQLAEQFVNNKVEAVLPFLPREAQDEARERGAETIRDFEDELPEARNNLLKWGILDPDKEYVKPSVNILGIEVGGQTYKPHQLDPKTGVPTGEIR